MWVILAILIIAVPSAQQTALQYGTDLRSLLTPDIIGVIFSQ
jgi:hypothetical protein